jgi:hypothetical protein
MVIAINPNVHEVLVYEDGIDTFPVAASRHTDPGGRR